MDATGTWEAVYPIIVVWDLLHGSAGRESEPMWDEDKQRRLDDLRRRESLEVLSLDEREILDQLLHEVEAAEAAVLQPTLGRLYAEQRDLQAGISRLEQQNASLTVLASQYEDLLRRARAQLAGFTQERETLRAAYEHALQDAGRR